MMLYRKEFNMNNSYWDKFLSKAIEEGTPTEIQAWHEGYVDALENVYDWLKEQPRVPTKVLMQLDESIKILGGGLYGED